MYILLIKTTVTQNHVALNYDRMRGLYFLVVIFAGTIVIVFKLGNTNILLLFA